MSDSMDSAIETIQQIEAAHKQYREWLERKIDESSLDKAKAYYFALAKFNELMGGE